MKFDWLRAHAVELSGYGLLIVGLGAIWEPLALITAGVLTLFLLQGARE